MGDHPVSHRAGDQRAADARPVLGRTRAQQGELRRGDRRRRAAGGERSSRPEPGCRQSHRRRARLRRLGRRRARRRSYAYPPGIRARRRARRRCSAPTTTRPPGPGPSRRSAISSITTFTRAPPAPPPPSGPGSARFAPTRSPPSAASTSRSRSWRTSTSGCALPAGRAISSSIPLSSARTSRRGRSSAWCTRTSRTVRSRGSVLLLRHRDSAGTLNLSWRHRASAGASVAGAGGVLLRKPRLVIGSLVVLVALNRDFYTLLARRRGPVHATAGVLLHAAHHLAGAAGVPVAIAQHLTEQRRASR